MKKIWILLIIVLLIQGFIVSARFYGVGQNENNTLDFERKAPEPTFFEKIGDFFSNMFSITGEAIVGTCEENSKCDDENSCTINDICVLGKCVGEPLCNDDDELTKDYCKGGICKFVKSEKSLCNQNKDCNDANECTDDICFKGDCFYYEKLGCISGCRSDKDCDDNNQETKDLCKNKRCVNIPKTIFRSQCVNDSQCNEGNECTIGTCDKGNCVYNSTACFIQKKDYTEQKEKIRESVERFSKIEVPFYSIIIFIALVLIVLVIGRTLTVIKKIEKSKIIKSSDEIDRMMSRVEKRLKKL